MLSFTASQLDSWIAAYLWPMARILALIAATPVLGHRSVPTRTKIGLALALTIVIAPLLPANEAPALLSPTGLATLLQQIFIGVVLGFGIRIVMAAIELAGEIIGLQMSLSFAGFFDLQSGHEGNAMGSWLTMIATLLYLSIDGHLIMIHALAESFRWFPIGDLAHGLPDTLPLLRLGAAIFETGLRLALPVIAVMLFINLALGIMTRATPQLNIFAIGFPFTLLLGLLTLYFALPFLETPLTNALMQGLSGFIP